MWNALKYGTWNVSQPRMDAVNALAGEGYPPLAAMVLAARGIGDSRQAHRYLDCETPLLDPFVCPQNCLSKTPRRALALCHQLCLCSW